jgi:UDP-N-acetylmuramoylalanine--D-glutamate ligase
MHGKFTNFEDAITKAYTVAGSDGVVLLSPGATSFNIFRDEFDRGRQFKQIVRGLK